MTAPAVRSRRSRGRPPIGTVLVLALCAVFSVLPMLLVVLGSLRPNADIISDPAGLPTSFYAENYVRAWVDASLGLYFFNSAVITLCALALTFLLYVPISYALGRWHFHGAVVIQVLFLLGLMVSLRIGILPLVRMLDDWRLIDNPVGLVLVYSVQAAPMTILILSTFFRQLPESLEEAALLDGASHPRIFASVMLPLIRPALAAALVLNVGPIWNDFFMPLVLLRSTEKSTIPVGITTFFGQYTADRGLLFAGIVIAVLPVVVFFALAMKQIVSGLTAGIEK